MCVSDTSTSNSVAEASQKEMAILGLALATTVTHYYR